MAGLTYIRPLGSGGFADVFLYEQDMPRRGVAVKVLPSDVSDPELLRMFNAEADVLAHLSAHPSIVTVYQAGISADGRPYIVMEYCPGSLAQRYRVERMPVDEVLAIGVKMASALESAHRAGLVHRDIKPSNILVTTFGVPVLADFGISSSLATTHGEQLFAMSVPWSAPEVLSEQTTGTIASEVWGLAATIFSLLAGHSPFERMEAGQNTRDHLRRRILRARFPRMARPDVPEALLGVLSQAMSRDPAARYATALELGEALIAVQREIGLAPTPLEVASDAWAPQHSGIDFADTTVRGPRRSQVAHETRRRVRPEAALTQRDEDTQVATARRGRVPSWAFAGGIAAGVGTVALIVWALASGQWWGA